MKIHKVQTIRSHAGLARFNATLDDDFTREIIRPIRSAFSWGPTQCVFRRDGRYFFWTERSQRVYEVWEVIDPEFLPADEADWDWKAIDAALAKNFPALAESAVPS